MSHYHDRYYNMPVHNYTVSGLNYSFPGHTHRYGYYPWSHEYGAYPLTHSYDVPSVRGLHRSMYGRTYRATSDYGYRAPAEYRPVLYSGYGKRYHDAWSDEVDGYRTYPRYSRYYGWY